MPTAIESTGSGNWATGSIWSGGVSRAGDSHDVTIKDGNNVTISQDERVHSITIENNATLTITGTRTLVIVGKDGSSYSLRAISGSTISGTLNVKVEGNGGYIREQGTGSINDLEVDLGSSSEVHYLDLALSLAGNLTITEGIFNTNASSNHALTVTGFCKVTGTLNCNASAVTLGSLSVVSGANFTAPSDSGSGLLTIGNVTQSTPAGVRGFYVNNGATFTHNSGTIRFTGTQGISLCHQGTATYNNVTFAQSGTIQYKDTRTGSDNWIIVGTLTINAGATLTNQNEADRINCTGNCSVSGVLDLNHASGGDHNFGSLTINSGGTYMATSGTTTITGKESGACFDNSGTFTHNNGTVSFTKSGGTWTTVFNSGGQSFYDVNVDSSTGQAIYANDPLTILNNFTIVRGTFAANAASSHDGDITVRGLTTIGGGANAAKLENDGRTLQLESVTVLSNGTIDVAEGTNNFGGIRNVGGTIT